MNAASPGRSGRRTAAVGPETEARVRPPSDYWAGVSFKKRQYLRAAASGTAAAPRAASATTSAGQSRRSCSAFQPLE